ncbi:uncharacterized protein TNCV_1669911 [Trichonephila clavipes]|nr:uncharacterized protein TNCV_1669911 [Trichonephila clavipes]
MTNSCVMRRHTGPAPGIMLLGGIGYHSRTHLGLATAIFQQYNARPYVARIVQRFFVNHQIKTASLAGSLSESFADGKHVVHGCSTIHPDYTPSCHTRSTLATCGSCLICCTPRTHPKSLQINAQACVSGDLQQ